MARRNFARSYNYAATSFAGPNAEALSLYEHARVSGYAGYYGDAAREFEEVLVLIGKSKGKADSLLAPTLSEYAS